MKKIFYSMCMLAMAAFTFTSCEDVPMPYDDPSVVDPGGDTPVTEEPTGDGTLDSPFNALAATNYASTLAQGETSTENVYIKGKVVSIKENFTTQYGNAAFYIADSENSSNRFYIYRALYLGNKKYSEGDLLAEGDEVVVCGKVTNYNGTLETAQNAAYIYSLNGKTSAGEGGGDVTPPTGEAKGDGTLENPFNSVAANAYASSLASGAESDDVVYIKGKISSIRENYSAQFGNASFYISDDGTSTNQFYVFRTLYLNNEKYKEGDVLAEGDEVVICGKVTNYMGNTPETVMNQSYLYSWTKGEGGGDNPGGGDVTENSITITASSLGLANGTEVGTQTLADGTVLTFDGGGNSNVPKYYNTGTNIRMYPKNSMKITAKKKIASVIFNVDEYQGAIYNASGDISAKPGSVGTNEKVVTVSGVNASETTITNTSTTTGAASQIRIVSLTINYAE